MAPKKKMTIKKPDLNKKNAKPIVWFIIIAIILALLLPYVNQGQQFKDMEIGLNQLEKNFNEGLIVRFL